MHLKKNSKLTFSILSVLFVLSLSRISDNIDIWVIDLFSHFPFQYALLSVAMLCIFLRKRNVLPSVLAGILLVFNASAIIDFGEFIQANEYTGSPFKVYSANLNKGNEDLSQLNREIKKVDPEIILFMEVTPKHFEQIGPVIQEYPYKKVIRSVGNLDIGFVFLSKYPILDDRLIKRTEVCNFTFEAKLEIDEKPMMFYGLHAIRPLKGKFKERKEQFLWLARHISKQSFPAVVAGDFNTTPFSPIFRRFVKTAGMKDSRHGFGWQPSWPTLIPPLWIPIDHVLVTPDIQVRKRTTGSYIGSDHYPVIAELSMIL